MEINYFESLTRMNPAYYDNIVEMNELMLSEDTLYRTAVDIFNIVHQGQYIPTMNVDFIKGMEQMLSIVSNVNEDLEFRRSRVLNRLSVKVPFNLDFLRRKLDTIYGVGNYVLNIGSGISIFDQVPINGYKKGDLWHWNGEDYPGRNLFIKMSSVVGWISSDGGILPDGSGFYRTSDFIEIDKSSSYFLTIKTEVVSESDPPWSRGFWYDQDKNPISLFGYMSGNYNYEIAVNPPATSAFARVSSRYISNDKDVIKLEKGTTSTPYSPAPEDLTGGKQSGYFVATKDNGTFDFNDFEYHGETIGPEILEQIEDGRFQINLETTAIDSNWYKEGYLTIQQMKPANMVYIHKPLLFENLLISENIYKADGKRFQLGVSKVGVDPLLKVGEYQEVTTV